ncbi:MAG: hypothetical protein K9G11_02525 [Rickettsiaceae bacterium]|nr:hypothetical protein [Rickettsiaceae bacterium]
MPNTLNNNTNKKSRKTNLTKKSKKTKQAVLKKIDPKLNPYKLLERQNKKLALKKPAPKEPSMLVKFLANRSTQAAVGLLTYGAGLAIAIYSGGILGIVAASLGISFATLDCLATFPFMQKFKFTKSIQDTLNNVHGKLFRSEAAKLPLTILERTTSFLTNPIYGAAMLISTFSTWAYGYKENSEVLDLKTKVAAVKTLKDIEQKLPKLLSRLEEIGFNRADEELSNIISRATPETKQVAKPSIEQDLNFNNEKVATELLMYGFTSRTPYLIEKTRTELARLTDGKGYALTKDDKDKIFKYLLLKNPEFLRALVEDSTQRREEKQTKIKEFLTNEKYKPENINTAEISKTELLAKVFLDKDVEAKRGLDVFKFKDNSSNKQSYKPNNTKKTNIDHEL